MSQESETVLRNSLDAVDRFRWRAIAAVATLFVVAVVGFASLMAIPAAARAGDSAGLMKIQFAAVAAQMFFVTLCTVVVALYITRMTKTILRAIELMSKEPPR